LQVVLLLLEQSILWQYSFTMGIITLRIIHLPTINHEKSKSLNECLC